MTTSFDKVDVESIKRCFSGIQGLTSATDFEVSAELTELLDDLKTESIKDLSDDIITAINSVDGAYVLVRIVSILSEKSSLRQEEEECLHTTYFCIYNLSDNRDFARVAANTCIVKKCIENLKVKEKCISGECQIDQDSADVIDFSLGIIYNISKEENVESLFDDDMPILHSYKNAEREDFAAMSVMILAHLSGGEADKIQDEKDTTAYLLNLLQRAIKDEDRRAVGFSSIELIESLGHLALNDNNKLTIVEKDGVSLLLDLIRGHREEEQIAASQCLWTLAFLPSIQKELQQVRGEFEALSVSCQDKVLRKILEGLLLTLQKPNAATKEKYEPLPELIGYFVMIADRQCRDGHIMVSYAWDGGYGQKAARKIASYLKSRGLNVWIDTDEMKGSFLDAMAQAVSDCYAFVLCASEKYRKSNNCRLEASSAHIQDKLIIPAVVGSSIPSKRDWLMLLCADKLFIDFTDETKFHQKCEELVQQIVSLSQVVDDTDVVPENVYETTSQPKTCKSIAEWSPHDVKTWIRDRTLQCFEEEFEEFDGSALMRLKKIQHDAPEFFYRYFCERKDGKEKRRLYDVMKLTEAIESL
ncbi:hypothetical protein HOLleu_20329 [Holothuria leucospilota]|uniref:TIR domain-containing protein n=1 Tax=Holothuria leucospilota TaxID=206669 RepID=A0A9Q1H8M8_HOLLE|nr:hypothetical protein HOLleu_20329 [Holothuria leucospilota]